jgi:Skp family chaperone for outer membrane proteins
MKISRLIALTTLLVTLAAPSVFAQTKIAGVDMKKLFNGYYKTRLAQNALEARKTELRKEIKDMADSLDKSQADYKQLLDQANDQAISSDERDRRKQALTDKLKEINDSKMAIDQFQRQAEAQLADQSQRMSGNLVTEIQKAVADKAKAGSYTFVLNTSNNETVVYASDTIDLTSAVLGQLNAGAPIDVSGSRSSLFDSTNNFNLR